MRYQIQWFVNPNWVNIYISGEFTEYIKKIYDDTDCDGCIHQNEFIDDFIMIDGITDIKFSEHSVIVVKMDEFDWNDIISHILKMIKKYIAPTEDMTDMDTPYLKGYCPEYCL